MKEKDLKITGSAKFIDDEGDQYLYTSDSVEALLEGIDRELSMHNLELYTSTVEKQNGIFICIKEIEVEEESK